MEVVLLYSFSSHFQIEEQQNGVEDRHLKATATLSVIRR